MEAVSFVSYRGSSNLAVQVTLVHHTPEPWSLEKATLIGERGETLDALRHRQVSTLSTQKELTVFAEFGPTGFTPDLTTLRLIGTDGRVVTLTHVVFP